MFQKNEHGGNELSEQSAGSHVISQESRPYMACLMPKTGTSAWIRYFRHQITGEREVPMEKTHEHFKFPGLQWGFTPKALRKTHRFSVVRHPFDRLMSFYRNVFLHDVEQGGGLFLDELGFG